MKNPSTTTMPADDYGSIEVDIAADRLHSAEAGDPISSSGRRSNPNKTLIYSIVAGLGLLVMTLYLAGSNGSEDDRERNGVAASNFKPFRQQEVPEEEEEVEDDWKGSEHFWDEQWVDHFVHEDGAGVLSRQDAPLSDIKTWTHRYYASSKHFAGPGHPVFLIVGGETDDMFGIYYKFVAETLAKKFGAYVFQPEHRFYGKSVPPVKKESHLKRLLTPEQATADMVRLGRHLRHKLGCSLDHSSPEYCPMIAVGGSYPARLALIMRLAYPRDVDAAYVSSSPLLGFVGHIDKNSYYNQITKVAEEASPGCSAAVKSTLMDVVDVLAQETTSFQDVAKSIGVCVDTIPRYIKTNAVFKDETIMLAGNIFAEYDMDYYPPTDETTLVKACKVFQNDDLESIDKVRSFFQTYAVEGDAKGTEDDGTTPCFDLMTQLPEGGKHPTISTADWSGAGGGNSGYVWDFQGCESLTTPVSFGPKSMFPPREWSMEWINEHCEKRFGMKPTPTRLIDEYEFTDLVGRGATRILFTNGMNDGWSACGSIMEDLSDTVLAINFPNGAHHSDITYRGPPSGLTDDVREGRVRIEKILGGWLEDMKEDQKK